MSVTLHTTHGDLKLELFITSTPRTTYNFLALCASSTYNHTPIHRLIPSFMFQTGGLPSSPNPSKPLSRSIYPDNNSLFEDEIRPNLRHLRGSVSMANKGPGTNGSQFFITFAPTPHLDGKNTVFGRVIEGAEEGGVLDVIERVEVDGKGRPVVPCWVEGVTVHANPLADE